MPGFNPEDVGGACFTCSLRSYPALCKNCMELHSRKTEPHRWLNNNITPDPEFKKLWEETEKQ